MNLLLRFVWMHVGSDFRVARKSFAQTHSLETLFWCTLARYSFQILDPYLPFTNGYGPEVDLWSLGVVLYIMLCGFPPFYDDSTAVLFKQIRKGEYSFPSPYWDDVSDEAKDIVSKVLVVEPSVRFTAQQCLDHPWITSQSEKTSKKLHSGHRAFLLIRKLPIFNNIDPACLQQVTALLRLVKVERGKAVIQAGEVGECMYFINSGTVQVLVNGNEVDRLTTGDFFGEVALTVSKQRTADVLSLGNTSAKAKSSDCVELFQLMRTDFEQVMDRFPILKTRLAQIGKARVNRASSGQSPDLGPRPSGGRASGSPQAARMDALDETKRAEPRPSPEPGRRSTEGSPSRSSQSPESKRGNKNKCKQQ
jgi:serine/threonine protein kinase